MDYSEVCNRRSLRLQDSTFDIIPLNKLFKSLFVPKMSSLE